jgi:branched-chain amino acid aminotransferase
VTDIWIDGELSSKENARVSVLDRGLLYGESAFERMRAYGGRVLGLDLHFDRLAAACDALGVTLDGVRLREELNRALGSVGADVAVRLMVTRGAAGLAGIRLIIVEAPNAPPREAYAAGVSAIVVHTDHSPAAPLCSHKWGGYASHLVLRARAEHAGAHEALVADASGAVVEGATSNVFAVVADTLVTAPDACGVRPGVTRHFVLEAAKRRAMAIEMRALDPSTLVSANEVFITSSVREVLPIASIDRRSVGNGTFEVARTLHADIRALVGAPSQLPWE